MQKPLSVELHGDREVRVVRSFHAPRALVWDAFTKPALVRRWMLGPPGWTMPICEMEVRAGGAFRWRWRSDSDGKEFGFYGIFLEVVATKKLVHEEKYDPGDVGGSMTTESCIVSQAFSESQGVTTLTISMLFASKEARDAAVSTGMTDGMEMSYANLDAILAVK